LSISRISVPVVFNALSSAFHGNPSCSLTRVKRSSAAANVMTPSSTSVTVESLSKGERPSTFMTMSP
jgi:hypothetical protein